MGVVVQAVSGLCRVIIYAIWACILAFWGAFCGLCRIPAFRGVSRLSACDTMRAPAVQLTYPQAILPWGMHILPGTSQVTASNK